MACLAALHCGSNVQNVPAAARVTQGTEARARAARARVRRIAVGIKRRLPCSDAYHGRRWRRRRRRCGAWRADLANLADLAALRRPDGTEGVTLPRARLDHLGQEVGGGAATVVRRSEPGKAQQGGSSLTESSLGRVSTAGDWPSSSSRTAHQHRAQSKAHQHSTHGGRWVGPVFSLGQGCSH